MSKVEMKEEERWRVEEDMRTLTEYQKIMKDEERKEKAIKELKKREKELKETIKEI